MYGLPPNNLAAIIAPCTTPSSSFPSLSAESHLTIATNWKPLGPTLLDILCFLSIMNCSTGAAFQES